MADKVTWVLELLDKVSPGATKASKALEQVGKSSETAAKGAALGDKKFAKLGSLLGSIGKGVAMAGVTTAVAVAGVSAALGVAGGKMGVEAAMFRQSSINAFEALLGSKDQATVAYAQLERLAKFLRIAPKDAVDGVKGLVGAGYQYEDALKLFQITADLKAFNPAIDLESITKNLAQVKALGRLTFDELKETAIGSGLGVERITKALGELNGGKSNSEILQMLSAGKISADQFAQALAMATKNLTGKDIGGYARDAAQNTLSGVMNGFKTAPMNLINAAVDKINTGPMAAKLSKILEVFDPEGPVGSKIVDGIGGIVDWIAEKLDGVSIEGLVEGVKDFGSVLASMWTVLSEVFAGLWAGFKPFLESFVYFVKKSGDGNGVQIFAESLAKVAKIVGKLAGGLLYLVGALVVIGVAFVDGIAAAFDPNQWIRLWDNFTGWLDDVVESMKSFGENIVQGIIDGILGKSEVLGTTVKGLADSIPAITKSALDIHSPSKVMAQLGEYTVDGFLVGLNDNATAVSDSMQTIVAAPAAPAAGGSGARAVTINAPVTVVVDGARDPAAVVAEFERSVSEVLGRVALQLGAAA